MRGDQIVRAAIASHFRNASEASGDEQTASARLAAFL
jgi:hypothetical protein